MSGRPGVLDVLTSADLPGALCYGPARSDRPVLAAGVVRHWQEPVAVVLAVDRATAEQAAAELAVEYRELPFLELNEAETADPLLPDGNVLRSVRVRRGLPADALPVDWARSQHVDPEEPGLAEPVPGADLVIGGDYALGFEGLAIAEDLTTTADPDGDGVVIVAPRAWTASDRDQLALCLAMDADLIRVKRAPGRLDLSGDLGSAVVAALLAVRHGRPVRLVQPGTDEWSSGAGPRIWMEYRHHATNDGRLVAVQADIRVDVGAYAGSAESMVAELCAAGVGPYRVPWVELDIVAVRTTAEPAPVLDGAGAIASCFAVEAQLDRLADRLDLSRTDVRVRNVLDLDDPLPTSQVTLEPSPIPALLAALDAVPLPDWHPDPHRARGIGVGVSMIPWGAGEGADPPAGATVRFGGGTGTVWCPGAEHNGTLRAAAAGVAAQAFGVPSNLDPSGDFAPRAAAPTVGLAVQAAIDELTLPARQRIAARMGLSAGLLRAVDGRLRSFDGVLDLALDEALAGDPVEASARVVPAPSEPLDDEGQGDAYPGYSYAACRAALELGHDGDAEIVQLLVAVDCGRVLSPASFLAAVEASARTGLRLATPPAGASGVEVVLRPGAVQVIVLPDGATPKGVTGAPAGAAAAALRAAVDAATGRQAAVLPIRGLGSRLPHPQLSDGAS